jgi:hypothetical protein
MISPKLAAKALRSLADNLDAYDPLREYGSLGPEGRIVATVEAVLHGDDAEHSPQDVAFLAGLGLPADAIAPAIDSRPQ